MRAKLKTSIKRARQGILEGTLLSIDPSVGSKGETGSMPGYAIFQEGEVIEYGIIEVARPTRDLPYKLQDIRREMLSLCEELEPDVVAVEQIPPKRYLGKFNPVQTSLLAAEAIFLACNDSKYIIRIKPTEWQAIAKRSGLWDKEKKADDMDALAIGQVIIELAKEEEK